MGRKNHCFTWLKFNAGLVPAGMEGVQYRRNELRLDAGDTL
ncbi:hypothetical protein [Desulfosporosinus sp. BICA1-9]|nr:hypothetical protein [Desulfosporosinus sp. BICA1-9]